MGGTGSFSDKSVSGKWVGSYFRAYELLYPTFMNSTFQRGKSRPVMKVEPTSRHGLSAPHPLALHDKH